MSRICFLCGEPIQGKATEEHIFANAFLSDLNLKRERMWFKAPTPIEYSRIRVPAHALCNTRLGSKFENYVLGLIRTMDSNRDLLAQLHKPNPPPVIARPKEALSQWLAKIHIGLIHWEANRRNHSDPEHQAWLSELLRSPVVAYVRQCLLEFNAFSCPSSLYHFDLPKPVEPRFRFDFASGLGTFTFFVRFNTHLLVIAIADAHLVQEWFTDDLVRVRQRFIFEESDRDPAAYLWAVADIWAVRENLPLAPDLRYRQDGILDLSQLGLARKPPIDGDAVNDRAAEIHQELVVRFSGEGAAAT